MHALLRLPDEIDEPVGHDVDRLAALLDAAARPEQNQRLIVPHGAPPLMGGAACLRHVLPPGPREYDSGPRGQAPRHRLGAAHPSSVTLRRGDFPCITMSIFPRGCSAS